MEEFLNTKMKELASRKGYGGSPQKPSLVGEVVFYDVDRERGFTMVAIEVKVRNLKTGNLPRGKAEPKLVIGYAKRNNKDGDKQSDETGLTKALADAMKRALDLVRFDPLIRR